MCRGEGEDESWGWGEWVTADSKRVNAAATPLMEDYASTLLGVQVGSASWRR